MRVDWLDRFTRPEPLSRYEWMTHAALVGDRVVVTDASCILALDVLAPVPAGLSPAHIKAIDLHLENPPTWAETTLPDLWQWLDRYDMERCPECNGHEMFTINEEGEPVRAEPGTADSFVCMECDGTGWQDVLPIREGRIAGARFDLNRLCRWLPPELQDMFGDRCRYGVKHMPAGTEKVKRKGRKAETVQKVAPVLTVAGDGWRMATMGLGVPAPSGALYLDEYDGPVLPTYHPGIGRWWPFRAEARFRMEAVDWVNETHGAAVTEGELFGETPVLSAV